MIGERREARTKSQAQTQLSFMEMNKGYSILLHPSFLYILCSFLFLLLLSFYSLEGLHLMVFMFSSTS